MTGGNRGAKATPLAALLALVALASPAMAADSQFDLDVALPVTVSGEHTLRADGGAMYLHGDGGQVSLLLSDADATLSRIIHRAYPILDSRDPELQWKQEVEIQEIPLRDGALQLTERRSDFQMLMWDTDIALDEGADGGDLHIGALDKPKTVRNELQEPLRLSVHGGDVEPFKHVLRSGLFQAYATDGRIQTDSFRLFISDAEAAYYPERGDRLELPAHFQVLQEPGSIYDPMKERWIGIGEHTEYVDEYLVLEGTGLLQMQFRDIPVQTFIEKATTDVAGAVTFPDAHGTVDVATDDGRDQHAVSGEELRLAGAFTFTVDQMAFDRNHGHIHGQGDVTQVVYGSQSHDYPWAAVAAISITTLLLGALAWAWSNGKLALGGIGGAMAGYARVQGDGILEHDGRSTVYTLVQANPGANFHELKKKVSFGASSLNYHLRVLERNEFVTRVKDGRYVRFFDRQSGTYSRHRKDAACALRNDKTAQIARFIGERPGAAQCDIADAFQIAASTVSWHIKRLRENGLVTTKRDSHYTRYYLGEAWDSLPVQEQQRFGVQVAA